MMPGLGRINPRDISRMMKSMGIDSKELEAERVIFELKDKRLVIENPSVSVVTAQGQKTYTVMGAEKEETRGVPKEDIEMVATSANVSKEKAKKALEETNGDLAEAIARLKKS
ncbi:MAG: nascent polypeptide-associated complex protein [archaeon]|nr:nascent polypeptide-associated complex protein [archaeon]